MARVARMHEVEHDDGGGAQDDRQTTIHGYTSVGTRGSIPRASAIAVPERA
jgi:hypothetical protein